MADKKPPKNVLALIADALKRKAERPKKKKPKTGWRANPDGSMRPHWEDQ